MMNKYKIRVLSEEESRKAQEYFFALGCVWSDTKCQTQMEWTGSCWYSCFEDGDLCRDRYDVNHHHKELCIAELQELVILHRNDVNDATHDDVFGRKALKFSEWYLWNYEEKIWLQTDFSCELSKLRPIQKSQDQQFEYAEFLTKLEDGTYILQTLPKHAGDDKASGLIPVPVGAEVYMAGFHGGHSAFYKDNFTYGFSPYIDTVWWGCSSNGLNYLKGNGGKIVWQRYAKNPSDDELITGADAFRALADGEKVDFLHDSHGWVSCLGLNIEQVLGGLFKLRLKPRTISINGIEVPAPFKPKHYQDVWVISGLQENGYTKTIHKVGDDYPLGCWPTEDQIKQVVAAHRKVYEVQS